MLPRMEGPRRPIPVGHRQVFHHANEPVSEVFFLNDGMASITTAAENGTVVEVATVGAESTLAMVLPCERNAQQLAGDRRPPVPFSN